MHRSNRYETSSNETGSSRMSSFERLLVPGCTELPECRCGKEMLIASIDPLPERADAHIRVYNRRAVTSCDLQCGPTRR